MATTETAAAWARVAALQNSGHDSQAADAAGAITGELYETRRDTDPRTPRGARPCRGDACTDCSGP